MKKLKIFISSTVDVIILMIVATIFSILISFSHIITSSTLFFILFPFVVLVKFYFMNSEIQPIKQQLEYYKNENESKDKVIKKFISLQGVED